MESMGDTRFCLCFWVSGRNFWSVWGGGVSFASVVVLWSSGVWGLCSRENTLRQTRYTGFLESSGIGMEKAVSLISDAHMVAS